MKLLTDRISYRDSSTHRILASLRVKPIFAYEELIPTPGIVVEYTDGMIKFPDLFERSFKRTKVKVIKRLKDAPAAGVRKNKITEEELEEMKRNFVKAERKDQDFIPEQSEQVEVAQQRPQENIEKSSMEGLSQVNEAS